MPITHMAMSKIILESNRYQVKLLDLEGFSELSTPSISILNNPFDSKTPILIKKIPDSIHVVHHSTKMLYAE